MWFGELLHPVVSFLVEFQLEPKCLCYRLVGNVVVTATSVKANGFAESSLRWTNASTCDDKIIVIAHAADSLDDFFLVVRNDFDPSQSLANG
jgi:hypothetical protein